MTTINAQRQLQATLRTPNTQTRAVGRKHVNHIKTLYEAAENKASALSKKVTSGLSTKLEMTNDQLIDYRLRGASEEEARQIAFQAHQQMDTLTDVTHRVEEAMKHSAILLEEERFDESTDPEDKIKGREWVEKSRRMINGQLFRYNESCDERQEQLEDFCNWFELYENIWPLPLVTNNIQFDSLQDVDSYVDEMGQSVSDMQKMWPKMGMMREDLAKIMSQAAEMGRRALSAELKEQITTLTRKLTNAEEQVEFLTTSLDNERNTTRDLRNELAKQKTLAEVQMQRKKDEIKALSDRIESIQESNRKQMEEMRALYAEREDKLKDTIARMKETTKAEIDGLKSQITDLESVITSQQENISELQSTIKERDEHIDRLRTTIRTLEGKLEKAEQELEAAKEELEKEKEEAKKREAKYLKTIEEQKRIIKVKDDEIKQRDRIIAEKEAKIEQLKQEIVELGMKIRQLEKQLEAAKKALEEAKAKIADLEKKVTSLKAACEKLKKEIHEKENEIKAREEDIRQLQEAAKQYVDKIAAQQEQIESLEQNLASTTKLLDESRAAHESDKTQWAKEKQAMEEQVVALKQKEETLLSQVKKKEDELKGLADEKQKMMDDYEKQIAEQTEAYEAQIGTLKTEVGELQAFKDDIVSKTYADADTEVEQSWFVENSMANKSKKSRVSTADTGGSAPDSKAHNSDQSGGLNAEQMQKVLNKFKTLREKMYFQRVAFERDSSEFRSGIKESLEYRTEIQTELNLDAALLRQKLDEILEICGANRIKITEMDDAESNRMIVDLCDESICFLESVGTANNQTPSRLACELVLDMNFEEIGGSENQEKMLRTKNAIAADIARACAGPVEKIKVRSLRPGEGSVLADLILCQGLKEEASTVDIFNLLKSQVTDSESLLKLGEVTCKVVEVRLKRRFYRNEPRKAGHLNMLKGIPRIMIDIEQVLEGIEGALADPVTLGNDPTMYEPHQERPSSAVVAQLRPLLSVSRMRMGAELAEQALDFSMINKIHNRHRISEHEAQSNTFAPEPHSSALKVREGNTSPQPPGSPIPGRTYRKNPVPIADSPLPSNAVHAARLAQPSMLQLGGPPSSNSLPSKREIKERQRQEERSAAFTSSDKRQKQGSHELQEQPSQDQMNQDFLRKRQAYLDSKLVDAKANTYGPSARHKAMHSHQNAPRDVVYAESPKSESVDHAIVSGGKTVTLDPELVGPLRRDQMPKFAASSKSTMQSAAARNNKSGADRDFGFGGSVKSISNAQRAIVAENYFDFGSLDPQMGSSGPSHDVRSSAGGVQLRFRTATTNRIPDLSTQADLSQMASKKAAKPISRPITTSRRITPTQLGDLSEFNVDDNVRLPQLMDVYEMQTSGIVGHHLGNRPMTLDGGEVERIRRQASESVEHEISVSKYGLLPDFGQKAKDDLNLAVGTTGMFRPKPQTTAFKTKKGHVSYDRDGTMHSPMGMGPWSESPTSHQMGRSFDASNSAPGYRPGKVIRSFDDSFKDRKAQSSTINPRLNAIELGFDNIQLIQMNAGDDVSVDPDDPLFYYEGDHFGEEVQETQVA